MPGQYIVRPLIRCLAVLPIVLSGCGGPPPPSTMPAAPVRPLAPLVAQQVIVVPTHALHEVDALGWTAQIPRSRELLRELDGEIETELAARGIAKQWVFPPALERASRLNPSYAVDPYALAADQLKNPAMIAGSRIADPLTTQLRTMVALQESARAVLIPVELRFEKLPSGDGVAVLHVAMVDGRLGEVRWIGDVRSDPSPTFSPRALVTSVAAHLADLIAAP
jgi:hypothetical protein